MLGQGLGHGEVFQHFPISGAVSALVPRVAGQEVGAQSGIARMQGGENIVGFNDEGVGFIDPVAACHGSIDGGHGGPGDEAKDAQHQHKKADDTLLNFLFHAR